MFNILIFGFNADLFFSSSVLSSSLTTRIASDEGRVCAPCCSQRHRGHCAALPEHEGPDSVHSTGPAVDATYARGELRFLSLFDANSILTRFFCLSGRFQSHVVVMNANHDTDTESYSLQGNCPIYKVPTFVFVIFDVVVFFFFLLQPTYPIK
jgi:hypothetical protein